MSKGVCSKTSVFLLRNYDATGIKTQDKRVDRNAFLLRVKKILSYHNSELTESSIEATHLQYKIKIDI